MKKLSLVLIHITLGMVCFSFPGVSSQTTTPQDPPVSEPQRKQLRAKSQEEFVAYQKIMAEQNPEEQIRLIENFLVQYPDTELKEYAFQAATQAYQAKNDYARVLTYGEMTLAENEDNLVALLILASAIPERTSKSDADREEKLGEAERYAQRALAVLSRLPKPPNVTEEPWERTRKDAESSPHAALGMIAMIREDFAKAEAEFKMATEFALRPDPVTLYRLGLCYSFQKKYDLALQTLELASASGGVKITNPDGGTRDLIMEAKEFTLKAKAAAEAAGSVAVAPQGSGGGSGGQ